MLRDAASLRAVVGALAALAAEDRPDVIAGIEARGFVFGPAVALQLKIGFQPIRKGGAALPGDTVTKLTGADYRGGQHQLATRRDLLVAGQRVVLVDDWIETGAQAHTAVELVADGGAEIVGITVVIDETSAATKSQLPTVRRLLEGHELPEQ